EAVRILRMAELHGFVPERGVRRVLAPPERGPGRSLLPLAASTEQDHLGRARAHAPGGGALGLADACERRRRVSVASLEPPELEEGGGAPRVGVNGAFPFCAGLPVLTPEEPGHAQVVTRLAVVAPVADDLLEPRHRLVVALERDRKPAGCL